jgi:rubrerythrin
MSVALDFSTLSLMDALDLAILIEVEALERYKLFASQLGHSRVNDPASVFRMMVGSEAKHAKDLSERREALFGDTPMRVTRSALYDVEAPEQGAVRWNMSTLHAYQIALSSERKAWAFYDSALPYVKDEQVRALFLELRDEETEHVELVEKAIAALPPSAAWELEDLDE